MSFDLSHLSRIETPWSIFRRAHGGSAESIQRARQALVERYGGAVRRYLRAALRDEEAADEVFQDFALRLVRGDFQAADPLRGKFRNYVKTVLHNMIVDYHRRAGREISRCSDDTWTSVAELAGPAAELLTHSWSQELLDRSWAHLRTSEQSGGAPYFSVLKMLADRPELSATEIAEQLGQVRGSEFTAGNVRVIVHRARQMFAEQLVIEVADSLDSATHDEIEQELAELNLLSYCKHALARKFNGAAADSDQRKELDQR